MSVVMNKIEVPMKFNSIRLKNCADGIRVWFVLDGVDLASHNPPVPGKIEGPMSIEISGITGELIASIE